MPFVADKPSRFRPDAPTAPPQAPPQSFAQLLSGAGDAGRQYVSDFASGIADAAQNWGRSVSLNPVTNAKTTLKGVANIGAGMLQAPINLVSPDASNPVLRIPTFGSNPVSDIAGAVMKPVGDVVGGVSRGVGAATGINPDRIEAGVNTLLMATPYIKGRGAAAPAVTKPATNITEVARALNLKVNPSDVKGAPIGSLIEGGSGSAKLKTRLSQENQPVITSHVREDLGLPPGPKLTVKELEAAQAPHNAKYKAVADTLKTVEPDAAFNRALNDAGSKWKAIIQLPGVAKLKKQFSDLGMLEAEQVMKQIAILRESGYNDLTSASIKTTPNRTSLKARGSAQVDIANAFEELIDRNAIAKGHANLVPELRDARKSLAKISTAKRALVNDDISATALKKADDRGTPLEGRMKAIADVARAHPDVVKDISKVKNKSPIGVLDVVAPTSLAVATGQPLVAAGILARPAGRSFVASERYQNKLGKPATDLKNSLPQYFKERQPRAVQSTFKANVKKSPEVQLPVELFDQIGEIVPGQVGRLPRRAIPNNQVSLELERPLLEPPPGEVGKPKSRVNEPRIIPGTRPGYFSIETPGEKSSVQVQGRAAAEKLLREVSSNVTPINRHKVSVKADADSGEFTATSLNGETLAQESGPYIIAKRNDTSAAARGKGEGKARYLALIKRAEAAGKRFASDFSLSPDEVRLWDSLKKDGFEIKVNPATKNKTTGNLVAIDPRLPVFEVTRKSASR